MTLRKMLVAIAVGATAVVAVTCHGEQDPQRPDGAPCERSEQCRYDGVCVYPVDAAEGVCRSWCDADHACPWANWLVCVPHPEAVDGVCVPGEAPSDGDADSDVDGGDADGGDADGDADADADSDADGSPDGDAPPWPILCSMEGMPIELGRPLDDSGPVALAVGENDGGHPIYGLAGIDSEAGLWFEQRSGDGTLLGERGRVFADAEGNGPRNVALVSASGLSGGWAVAWDSNHGVAMRLRNIVGGWARVNFEALSDDYRRHEPSFLFDGTNVVLGVSTEHTTAPQGSLGSYSVVPTGATATFGDLSTTFTFNERPVIAYAPPGPDSMPYAAVWQGGEASDWRVFLSRFRADGSGGEVLLTDDAEASVVPTTPTMVPAPVGAEYDFVVAWVEFSPSRSGLVVAPAVAVEGSPLGTPILLEPSGGAGEGPPSLVRAGAEPLFAVAWSSVGPTGSAIHLARMRYDEPGLTLVGLEVLVDGDEPSLVWSGDGFGLTWRESGRHRFARFSCGLPE